MALLTSGDYLQEVKANWEKARIKLFERDGLNANFAYGGHDLKNNPKLQGTLNAIAESYVLLCAKKAGLFDRKYAVADELDAIGTPQGRVRVLAQEQDKISAKNQSQRTKEAPKKMPELEGMEKELYTALFEPVTQKDLIARFRNQEKEVVGAVVTAGHGGGPWITCDEDVVTKLEVAGQEHVSGRSIEDRGRRAVSDDRVVEEPQTAQRSDDTIRDAAGSVADRR